MKNVVSFETARRLKEAGFKQPRPEFGQVWFDQDGAYVIGNVKNDIISGAWSAGDCFTDASISSMLADVFAPTATDILEQLPHNFCIRGKSVFSLEPGDAYNIGRQFYADNPAEAAALAWLAINEKQ